MASGARTVGCTYLGTPSSRCPGSASHFSGEGTGNRTQARCALSQKGLPVGVRFQPQALALVCGVAQRQSTRPIIERPRVRVPPPQHTHYGDGAWHAAEPPTRERRSHASAPGVRPTAAGTAWRFRWQGVAPLAGFTCWKSGPSPYINHQTKGGQPGGLSFSWSTTEARGASSWVGLAPLSEPRGPNLDQAADRATSARRGSERDFSEW